MRVFFEALGFLLVWLIVGYVMFFIDPSTLKDVVIKNAYLPAFLLVLLATSYSFFLLVRRVGGAICCGAIVVMVLGLAYARMLTPLSLGLSVIFLVYMILRMVRQ